MQAGVPCQTNQHVCRAGLQCRCAQPPLGVDTTHARSASAAAGVRRRLAWNMKQQSAPCSPRRSSALATASCCCVAGQGPSRKAPGANSTMRATSEPGNSSCGGGVGGCGRAGPSRHWASRARTQMGCRQQACAASTHSKARTVRQRGRPARRQLHAAGSERPGPCTAPRLAPRLHAHEAGHEVCPLHVQDAWAPADEAHRRRVAAQQQGLQPLHHCRVKLQQVGGKGPVAGGQLGTRVPRRGRRRSYAPPAPRACGVPGQGQRNSGWAAPPLAPPVAISCPQCARLSRHSPGCSRCRAA